MMDFGYPPDENGQTEFMTVETDFVVTDFESYMELYMYMVQLIEKHTPAMPIPRLNHEAK